MSNILNGGGSSGPKLEHISLLKSGVGELTSISGGLATVYSYTPTPSNFFVGAGGATGSSFIPSASGVLSSVEFRVDNAFNNSGTMTARLIQITGAALGSTPAVISTATPIAYSPALFPGGSFLPITFSFPSGTLVAGTEYAILLEATAGSGGVFFGAGTNQAGSTNYSLNAVGANLQLSGNQATFFEIVQTASLPVTKLETDSTQYIAVKNLPPEYHTIDPIDVVFDDNQVAFVTINRNQTAPTVVPVTVVNQTAFVPNNNNVIIARRRGSKVYYGVDDLIVLEENVPTSLVSVSTPYLEIDFTNKIGNLFTGTPFNLGTTGEGLGRLTRIGKSVFGNLTIFFDTDHDFGAPIIISSEMPFPLRDPGVMIGRTQGFSYILVAETVPGVSNDAFIFPIGCITSNVGGPEPAVVFVQLSESLGDGGINNVFTTVNPVDLTGRAFTLFASISYEEA